MAYKNLLNYGTRYHPYQLQQLHHIDLFFEHLSGVKLLIHYLIDFI